MADATGKVYASYMVKFYLDGKDSFGASALTVDLIEGYSRFEDIRHIISARIGCRAQEVEVFNLQKVTR